MGNMKEIGLPHDGHGAKDDIFQFGRVDHWRISSWKRDVIDIMNHDLYAINKSLYRMVMFLSFISVLR
jgi:hypothetical protein